MGSSTDISREVSGLQAGENVNNLVVDAPQCLLLAEMVSRMDFNADCMFWDILPDSIPDLRAHLPALAGRVRRETNQAVLKRLACHPLPATLSAESVPWFQTLVEAWEQQREVAAKSPDRIWEYGCALLALARLDGCGMPPNMRRPSRLPELLEEAYQVWQWEPDTGRRLWVLSGLAAWQPTPGVTTDPAVLTDWMTFWQKRFRSRLPTIRGIAAQALLNLLESGEKTGKHDFPSEGRLLDTLVATIPDVAQQTRKCGFNALELLSWQPRNPARFPVGKLERVIQSWLKVANDGPGYGQWMCQQTAWQQLVRWNSMEDVEAADGERERLHLRFLSWLATAMQQEAGFFGFLGFVTLWELAQWNPVCGKRARLTDGGGPEKHFLDEIDRTWQRHRQHCNWLARAAAWWAGIRLHRNGLASETACVFRNALLDAVDREKSPLVLFILAQWGPEKDAPPGVRRRWFKVWHKHLQNENHDIRLVAAFAFLQMEPDDDVVIRREKLRAALNILPKELCPKIPARSVVEMMNLSAGLTIYVDSPAVQDRFSRAFGHARHLNLLHPLPCPKTEMQTGETGLGNDLREVT